MSTTTTTTTQYLCEAWLLEGQSVTDHHNYSSSETMFLIDIYAHIVPYNYNMVTEEESIDYDDPMEVPTIVNYFWATKRQLIDSNYTSWSIITRILVEMNIPAFVHPMMIQKIHECARASMYMDRKIIPMVVQLKCQPQMLSGPMMMDSLISSSRLAFIGANKASIDALEKVEVEGFSRQCVICLEDMLVGAEATRMPCFHVYHGDCVKIWLEKSNACPLCRLQLPS